MALARLELGATLSMYGQLGNPFEFVAPESFGGQQYFDLLTHDAAVHLNALKTDPMLQTKSNKSATGDGETLAYLRRLTIVKDMLVAARNANDGKFRNSADEYLNAVARYYHLLERNARTAAQDTVIRKTEWGEKTQSRSTRVVRGTVTSVSPITRACQQSFLGIYGR